MDQLTKLRQVIDNELSDLTVTDKLRKKTFKKMFKNETPRFMFLSGQKMKPTMLFSTLILITSLSLNMFLKNTSTPHVIYNSNALKDQINTDDKIKMHSFNYSLSNENIEEDDKDNKEG